MEAKITYQMRWKVPTPLVSVVVFLQDSPEQGVLYLTRGLINVLQNYTWEQNSNSRAVIYLHALDMLSAAAQETYLYHIEKGTLRTSTCC